MNIKHIFFDLDHTLWDFDKNSNLTFQYLFKELQVEISLSDFLEVYVPINFNYWKLYREEKVSKSDLRYGRLKDTFDTLKYTISDNLINTISEDYIINLANHNHLIEGTVELLEYLKPKYNLHIITNGFEEIQSKKMKKSGISKYFDKIITSESVGVKKPNPRVFEYALKEAKAKVEDSIMIGDSYEADVMGALNFGMSAIHFNLYKSNKNNGVLAVDSLLDLKQYL